MSGSPFDKLRVSGVVLRSRVLLLKLTRGLAACLPACPAGRSLIGRSGRQARSILFSLVVLAGVAALVMAGRPGATAFPGALTPAAEAALAPGQADAWDSVAVHAPSVVRLPTGPAYRTGRQAGTPKEYLLWYDGTDRLDPYSGWAIGLATSGDGLHWERRPDNPVLSPGLPGSWDGASVHDPRVVWDGRRFLMWYSGYDGARWRIGLASSDDGAEWVKHAGNPVLEPGPLGSWDEASVAYSSVVLKDGRYRMWYQGGDSAGAWRIGYATSVDGVHWSKSNRNPVLASGPPGLPTARLPDGQGQAGSWDAERVFTPHVLPWGEGYLMLYTGGPGAGIGYAFSTDGEKWQKAAANPALKASEGGQVLTAAGLREGEGLTVWYAEKRGERMEIRRAVCSGCMLSP